MWTALELERRPVGFSRCLRCPPARYQLGIRGVDPGLFEVDSHRMGINVLGPLGVDGDPHLSPRDRVILAALATSPGTAMSADRLADALWREQPPSSSAKVLQGCVMRLRKALGADAIKTSPRGYQLAVPTDEVDAQRFERMVMRGRELLAVDEADRAAYLLSEALALWRGPAFAELDGWEWAEVESGRLDQLRLEAEELRVDALLRAG